MAFRIRQDFYPDSEPMLPDQDPLQAFSQNALQAAPAPAGAPKPTQFNREAFRDAWMGTGTDLGAQNALLSQYGLNLDKSGRATLPTGEMLDLRQGAQSGLNKAQWMGVGSGLKTGQAPSAPTLSPQTFGASGAAGAGGSITGVSTASGAVDPAVRDALLALMKRSQPGPIDPMSDPNLAPQARAFQAARTRQARQQRAESAERAAFTGENLGGQGSGAFESGLGSIQEAAGRDIAGYEAGLVGQEVESRRADLLNALQIASAIGARDQEATIRMQLAQMDESFRRAQLAQQGQQFGAELSFNQGRWNDQYGLGRAQFEADQNRLALLAAMGG